MLLKGKKTVNRWVEIEFDCLPLRSHYRTDAPIDATPVLAAKLLRIKHALETHGSHNTYYLHNARCRYRLTNDANVGTLFFRFEGVVFTDDKDQKAVRAELTVDLEKETCSWLSQSVVAWFKETVKEAVVVEFNRYIEAGDLELTRQRMAKLEKSLEASQGYVGMYL